MYCIYIRDKCFQQSSCVKGIHHKYGSVTYTRARMLTKQVSVNNIFEWSCDFIPRNPSPLHWSLTSASHLARPGSELWEEPLSAYGSHLPVSEDEKIMFVLHFALSKQLCSPERKLSTDQSFLPPRFENGKTVVLGRTLQFSCKGKITIQNILFWWMLLSRVHYSTVTDPSGNEIQLWQC